MFQLSQTLWFLFLCVCYIPMVIAQGNFPSAQKPTMQTGLTLGLTTHWVSQRSSSCPDLLIFLSSSGFSVVCLTWTVLSLFSPCCLLPWASGLKSAARWPRHCHLSSSHQLRSTRHQHFGQGEGTDGSMISLQVSTQPGSAWWTAVLTVWLTLVQQADIPHISQASIGCVSKRLSGHQTAN